MKKEEMLIQAQQYEREKNWGEALIIYNSLLSEPGYKSSELLERCAWCASRAGKYIQAIDHFTELSKFEPHRAKWFYCIGYQYYMQKKWDLANEQFEKALELYPDYLIVKYRYGYSLRQTCGDKYVLTKDAFWRALQQFNECTQIWGKYSEDERKKNSNTYADICFQKGKLLVERNQINDAIDSFETALSLNNNFEECRYQVSKAYLSIGNVEKAKAHFPSKSNKYYIQELQVDILLAENNLNDAEAVLKRLIQTRRKDYLYRKMAEISLKKGDRSSAISYLLDAEKANPRNHITIFEKAKLLLEENLLLAARKEIMRAIELKKKAYGGNYLEAETLLAKVSIIIDDTAHFEDDASKLQIFNPTAPKNTPLHGVIKKYNTDKGFGFIKCGEKSYFFHISSVKKSMQHLLREGSRVTFDEGMSDKGPVANNVIVN
jgi:tetratricopeptide (TPR) repeat protein